MLNLSPPLNLDPRWFKVGGVAYTMAKYNMSMAALGMAEEFRGKVAFNCLWPRTPIATAAVEMVLGTVGTQASRTVDIMADSAYWILTQPHDKCTGNCFIDDEVRCSRQEAARLRVHPAFAIVQVMTQKVGLSEKDLDRYRVSKFVPLMPDLYVGDPAAMERYVDAARKVSGAMSSLMGSFKRR